mgnify:FL=1
MKLVLQRVLSSSVSVGTEEISAIGRGYLLLVGIESDDDESVCKMLADKVAGLRVFEDQKGKMNLSINDINGEILIVSNFTICADCRKGKRPSFSKAKNSAEAKVLYDKFCDQVQINVLKEVKKGVFGADMKVKIINDGPVTIVLDSKEI